MKEGVDMKNTLTIVTNPCVCECLDSVNDKTNTIFVSIKVDDEASNPVLKLYKDGVNAGTKALGHGENIVEISTSLFSSNTVIDFQYVSNNFTGENFTITFPEILEGDMLLKRNSNFSYSANWFKKQDTGGECKCVIDDALSDTSENAVQNKVVKKELDKLFQYVSEGKTKVASAITDKGVPTENDATFQVMSDNIRKIPTGGGGGSGDGSGGDFPTDEYTNYILMTISGKEFNEALKEYAEGYGTLYSDKSSHFQRIVFATKLPTSTERHDITQYFIDHHVDPWIAFGDAYLRIYDVETIYGYTTLVFLCKNIEKIFLPIDSSYMFKNFNNIGGIVDFSLFDTRYVLNMEFMFSEFGNSQAGLTNLQLGETFYTHNVRNMEQMFHSCGYYTMEELNLGPNFDTSKLGGYWHGATGDNMLTATSHMFNYAGRYKMKELDLGSKFNAKPTMDMFWGRTDVYPLTVYATKEFKAAWDAIGRDSLITGASCGVTVVAKY